MIERLNIRIWGDQSWPEPTNEQPISTISLFSFIVIYQTNLSITTKLDDKKQLSRSKFKCRDSVLSLLVKIPETYRPAIFSTPADSGSSQKSVICRILLFNNVDVNNNIYYLMSISKHPLLCIQCFFNKL